MRHESIYNTHPTVVKIHGESTGETAYDKDGNVVNLDNAKVTIEVAGLEREYKDQEYARKRKREYPKINEFLEAYTEKEIGGNSTKWDAYVIKYNKVKTDNPK